MNKLSIIIPCYNEEESLDILYSALEEMNKVIYEKYECEYIFVNDGSKDKTILKIKELASKDEKVKYISFSRNFGKEAAIYAGLTNAKGDLVTLIDADMQDPPSLIPEMIDIIEKGEYDSVATRRSTRKGEPKLRSLFARMFYKIINHISDSDIVNGARDFRLMKRSMVDAILSMTEYNRFSKGIFGWVGFKTYWLSYKNIERAAGQTKWNFKKLFKYAVDGIIDFSTYPLRISFTLSVINLLCSIGLLIPGIIRRVGGYFNGYIFLLASLICFMTSVILFALGVISLYIANIHQEVRNRPHYIVSETNCIKE